MLANIPAHKLIRPRRKDWRLLGLYRLLFSLWAGWSCSAQVLPPWPFDPPSSLNRHLFTGQFSRYSLPLGQQTGLSDLALDDQGKFWSITERQHHLIRLRLNQDPPEIDGEAIPILGLPTDYDGEALAWLPDNHFAIGTETQLDHRNIDIVAMGRLAHGEAAIERLIRFPYPLFAMEGRRNEGLEGLCSAGETLILASESHQKKEGKRLSPIARYEPNQAPTWQPYWLQLTSRRGKISAIACRKQQDGQSIDVWAIERHFAICHILAFTLGPHTPSVIVPKIVVDLGATIGALPNMEGLVITDPYTMFLLSDNDFGFVTGPTQMIRLDFPTPLYESP